MFVLDTSRFNQRCRYFLGKEAASGGGVFSLFRVSNSPALSVGSEPIKENGSAKKAEQAAARQAAIEEKKRLAEEAAAKKAEQAAARQAAIEEKKRSARKQQAEKAISKAPRGVTISLFGFGQKNDDTDNSSVSSTAPGGVPTISRWRQERDGSITGVISGSGAFKNGDPVTTSPIRGKAIGGTVVTTKSGSR